MSLLVVSGAANNFKMGLDPRQDLGRSAWIYTRVSASRIVQGDTLLLTSIHSILCRPSCNSNEVLWLSIPRDGRSRCGLPILPRQDRPSTGLVETNHPNGKKQLLTV